MGGIVSTVGSVIGSAVGLNTLFGGGSSSGGTSSPQSGSTGYNPYAGQLQGAIGAYQSQDPLQSEKDLSLVWQCGPHIPLQHLCCLWHR